MIFITVGTQLPFDRLIRILDSWVEETGRKDVFAQIGENGHTPKNIDYTENLSPADFEERMQTADLVIAHAGVGTILGCMDRGTPLLILPRQEKLGEHRNNHQVATASLFRDHQNVHVAADDMELAHHLSLVPGMQRTESTPSANASALIQAIREFL